MRTLFCIVLLLASISAHAAEERIIGVLEKTVKSGASAQITDALNEIYYINKSDDADKLVAEFAGKNIKVVITGTVESREGDPAYFLNLKTLETYKPKMPAKDSAADVKAVPDKEPAVPALNEKK
jgi:hypothetical protein